MNIFVLFWVYIRFTEAACQVRDWKVNTRNYYPVRAHLSRLQLNKEAIFLPGFLKLISLIFLTCYFLSLPTIKVTARITSQKKKKKRPVTALIINFSLSRIHKLEVAALSPNYTGMGAKSCLTDGDTRGSIWSQWPLCILAMRKNFS